MPLSLRAGTGLRMTPAYRGLADTRPWFFEAAMDENNFKPVLNEFARIENFCCSDYTLFPSGAPPGCEAKVMCTNGTCAVRTTGRCPAPPAG